MGTNGKRVLNGRKREEFIQASLKSIDEGEQLVKYNNDRPRQAYELALLGLTEEEIARVIGVGLNTITQWKEKYPDFMEQISRGKIAADARVAASLFKCATGYEYEEEEARVYRGEVIKVTVRRYKGPDSWAANKWLSVRQRALWADVQRTESLQTTVNINKFDLSGLSIEELEMLKRIGMKQLSDGKAS